MEFKDGFYREQDEVKTSYDRQRKERHGRWKAANAHKGKQKDAPLAAADSGTEKKEKEEE
jgi:hypothetical protein